MAGQGETFSRVLSAGTLVAQEFDNLGFSDGELPWVTTNGRHVLGGHAWMAFAMRQNGLSWPGSAA